MEEAKYISKDASGADYEFRKLIRIETEEVVNFCTVDRANYTRRRNEKRRFTAKLITRDGRYQI